MLCAMRSVPSCGAHGVHIHIFVSCLLCVLAIIRMFCAMRSVPSCRARGIHTYIYIERERDAIISQTSSTFGLWISPAFGSSSLQQPFRICSARRFYPLHRGRLMSQALTDEQDAEAERAWCLHTWYLIGGTCYIYIFVYIALRVIHWYSSQRPKPQNVLSQMAHKLNQWETQSKTDAVLIKSRGLKLLYSNFISLHVRPTIRISPTRLRRFLTRASLTLNLVTGLA